MPMRVLRQCRRLALYLRGGLSVPSSHHRAALPSSLCRFFHASCEACSGWGSSRAYRMVLLVRRRIHCGIGRFCFCALASFCLVRKDFWLCGNLSETAVGCVESQKAEGEGARARTGIVTACELEMSRVGVVADVGVRISGFASNVCAPSALNRLRLAAGAGVTCPRVAPARARPRCKELSDTQVHYLDASFSSLNAEWAACKMGNLFMPTGAYYDLSRALPSPISLAARQQKRI